MEYLLDFRRREGVSPTVREMQAFMGFRSPRSVTQYLDALEEAGFVERSSGARRTRILKTPRSIALPDRRDTVLVPVVGRVAAGTPFLAEESIDGYVPVSTRLASGAHAYFLLRVRGDSMDRAGIQDGDLVLVRRQQTAEAGTRVVALIDDEATVKVFRPSPDAIVLEPKSSNARHKPIVLDRDIEIQGVVVAAIPGSHMGRK